MATREVAEARAAVEQVEAEVRQLTGVIRTRREQARARLDRAMAGQKALQEEYDRLIYTLNAGFGIQLGQQTLAGTSERASGPRTTFLTKTTPTQLRSRLRELRAKLNEAPG